MSFCDKLINTHCLESHVINKVSPIEGIILSLLLYVTTLVFKNQSEKVQDFLKQRRDAHNGQ